MNLICSTAEEGSECYISTYQGKTSDQENSAALFTQNHAFGDLPGGIVTKQNILKCSQKRVQASESSLKSELCSPRVPLV